MVDKFNFTGLEQYFRIYAYAQRLLVEPDFLFRTFHMVTAKRYWISCLCWSCSATYGNVEEAMESVKVE